MQQDLQPSYNQSMWDHTQVLQGYIKPKPGKDAILISSTVKRSVQLIPSSLP